MPSEAEHCYIPRTIWVSEKLETAIMKYARDKGITNTVSTMNVETGKPTKISIPNMSEAYRTALEEFFAGRENA